MIRNFGKRIGSKGWVGWCGLKKGVASLRSFGFGGPWMTL